MNSVQWITLSPHWCGSFTSCWPFVCKKVKIPRRRRRSRFCQFHVDVFQPLPSFPTRLLSRCSRSTVLAVVTDKILTAPLQKHVLFAEVTVCEIFSFRTKTKNTNKCRKWGKRRLWGERGGFVWFVSSYICKQTFNKLTFCWIWCQVKHIFHAFEGRHGWNMCTIFAEISWSISADKKSLLHIFKL